MSAIAVIAHQGKNLDGGLPDLRKALADRGVTDLQWYEVEKSRDAPNEVQRALKKGADLIFAWGGDGIVQRCVDALAKSKASLAIVPAGTANLLAKNLGVPHHIAGAAASHSECTVRLIARRGSASSGSSTRTETRPAPGSGRPHTNILRAALTSLSH